MSSSHVGRKAASAALAAAILLLAGVGFGASHVAVARPVVNATGGAIADSAVENFAFSTVEFANVPTNTTINLTFSNDDTSGNDHTFTILDREGWVIPRAASPGNITSLLSTYGALVWVNASSQQTKTTTFNAPATGWYEFLCTISGHYQAGMFGFIAFGEALPTNLSVGPTSQGPGLVVFLIVGSIVALTVLAIVLGFVVGRRHGAVHEMPPERLGYPEPAPPPPAAEPPHGR